METGRVLAGATMAPVKLEFPASVKALLRTGELTVYDILELVVNGVNAVCGSYDTNMGKLEGWTGDVVDWTAAVGKELSDRLDTEIAQNLGAGDESRLGAWLKAKETDIEDWKTGISGAISDGLLGENTVTLDMMTDNVKNKINGAVSQASIGTYGGQKAILMKGADNNIKAYILVSDILEGVPSISLDSTNDVLTINGNKYKLTKYVAPSTPSGGGSTTPSTTVKQYAWYGSSATSSISNVSDGNSVVLSGEKEITITADKSDKKKCMWVAVKTDGDYKVSKAMDAEDDVVQHSVKYVGDYTVYYVETMFYQEQLKFKIIKK